MYLRADVPLDLISDEMLKVKGYRIIEYEFKTEDNAYVSFWRIDSEKGLKEDPDEKKTPVVIQHGLLDCAMSWFLL